MALSLCFSDHLTFVSDFRQLSCRYFLQFFPFFLHCCLCIWYFHGFRRRDKFVHKIVVNSYLFLRCGLHGSSSETLPCVSSKTRRLQQYKHILSCVVQLRHKFPRADEVEFYKALLPASEFPTFYERFFIMSLNSSSSSSLKKIQRNLLALSFLLFFAFRCISGHTLSGLEVVCFLVSLSPGPCISIRCLLIQNNESREICPCIRQISFSINVQVSFNMFLRHHIQSRAGSSGNVNVLQWNRERFFSRHVQFD